MHQELDIMKYWAELARSGGNLANHSMQLMARVVVPVAVGLLLSPPPLARAEGPCIPMAPEAVVTCLGEAFNHRDVKLLDGLFSPDFVYVQGTETIDRATELRSHERMFKSSQVKAITFSAEGISAQPQDDSWLVTVAATTLVVSIEREGKSQEFTVHSDGYRFFVRSAGDSFQIYRWEDPTAP